MEITIQVGAGPRTLCSCSRCDRRWWRADGRLTDLSGVIADLADPAPPGRRPARGRPTPPVRRPLRRPAGLRPLKGPRPPKPPSLRRPPGS
ncbi:MAG: hypothetical protein D6683_08145 [Actinomyces sp.]|nr:MAG: hypothetical protein D6683_08145 [Actinomyces sp.]